MPTGKARHLWDTAVVLASPCVPLAVVQATGDGAGSPKDAEARVAATELKPLQLADCVIPARWFGCPYPAPLGPGLRETWHPDGAQSFFISTSVGLDNPVGSPRLELREGSGFPEAKQLAEVQSCSTHLEAGGTGSLLTTYFPWFLQPCPRISLQMFLLPPRWKGYKNTCLLCSGCGLQKCCCGEGMLLMALLVFTW